MQKSLVAVFALVVLLAAFVGGGVSHAEESGGTTPITSGLDVSPMTPEKAANGFVKLGDDLSVMGKGIVVPLTVGGILLAGVFLVIGVVFSKKLLVVGWSLLGISLLLWIFLGDMKTTIKFFSSLGMYIRSLWA